MSCGLNIMAQSSMTDDQVMRFVQKEQEAGTSQSQIVTKLMQRGVNIQQIRRIKKKYDRLKKEEGLGTVEDDKKKKSDDRTRKNNGKLKDSKEKENDNFRVKSTERYTHTYDEEDPEFMEMQEEMESLLPQDSIKWLEKILEDRKKAKKKVFGRDIFNNKDLTFEPNMNIATPQNYYLGPGDAVIIEIYGASQKTIESTVSPDGTVTIEGYGPVQVSGLSVAQANARLRSMLGSRYSSSRIQLTVGQTRTIMVNVMGEVKAPGTYTLSAFASIFHALYMAGGTNDLGTLRNIKVYRNNRLVTTVDIYDYILNGKLTGNVRLADNDVISVGTYDCIVNITGKVKRPMLYEMKKNESIGTLLKYAGGFTGDAYKKSVRVFRKTGREHSVYNVGEFDVSAFHVADGDSVTVDSILPRYENTVQVKGAVFRPGMYQVGGDINSVRTLLQHAEGVTEEAFTAHAVMHRMKPDRTLEVVQVDVEGIMNGSVADIPLKSNDVLFIPTKQEMMQEQTITIHGEVQYPGIYKYASNETIEDFILQAGGLKEAASMVKVDISRRIIDSKAITTDSVIARTYTLAIKDGFVIDGEPGFTLMPFDEVYVRRSPGYYEQQNITIEGEVMFAGTYTLSKKNERLSDIIKAAGGLNDRAYVQGARLERKITEAERIRMETARKIQLENLENIKREEEMASSGKITDTNLENSQTVKKYNIEETTYVGIELDKALANPGGDEDIVLREGDRIIVPQYNGTVKINGAVMYPNTVGYVKGKGVSYYIDQAGGFGNNAKKSKTFIIYMNGTIAKAGHNAKPMPGCEIIVPEKAKNKHSLAETMSIGTSIASIATMIATMANLLK